MDFLVYVREEKIQRNCFLTGIHLTAPIHQAWFNGLCTHLSRWEYFGSTKQCFYQWQIKWEKNGIDKRALLPAANSHADEVLYVYSAHHVKWVSARSKLEYERPAGYSYWQSFPPQSPGELNKQKQKMRWLPL